MADIEVTSLHKRYGDHVAVHDVSFHVETMEIFGIVGPNGAGKTTVVESIGGLRHPDGGSVRVLGLDPQRDVGELRNVLGMQLQRSELPERITVHEALRLFASFYRTPADPERVLGEWRLATIRDSEFGTLSGGERQRLSIALALIGQPRVAILDELTTGLDPQARRDTWALIERVRDTGVTVVLVTHFMEEAERLADRVAVLDDGRLIAVDTPARLVGRLAAGQRLRFRPSQPIDGLLTGLPEVSAIQQTGASVEVTGSGDLLHAVSSVLARNSIVAADLRIEQATLDDAFVALTGSASQERIKERS
jgi:ABC-2 type transport system ATP-binding protein